jgi:hypothetical protein
MKKLWLILLPMLAIGFGFLAAPLRAQFVYVTNSSGYTI